MAQQTQFPQDFRSFTVKQYHAVQAAAPKIWENIRRIWSHPILVAVLFLAAGLLLYLLITQAYPTMANCNRFMKGKLVDVTFICDGIHYDLDTGIHPFDIPIPIINVKVRVPLDVPVIPIDILQPMKDGINQILGTIRSFLSWSTVIFFALVSLVLTFILQRIIALGKKIVEIIIVKEERQKFFTSFNLFLLIFTALCLMFYLSNVR